MGVLRLLSWEDATADWEFPFLEAPAPQLSADLCRLSVPGLRAQGSSRRPTCACLLSRFARVQLLATLLARPASLSLDSPGENAGVGCPPPGDLPYPGVEPGSLMPAALAGGHFTTGAVD